MKLLLSIIFFGLCFFLNPKKKLQQKKDLNLYFRIMSPTFYLLNYSAIKNKFNFEFVFSYIKKTDFNIKT